MSAFKAFCDARAEARRARLNRAFYYGCGCDGDEFCDCNDLGWWDLF